MVLLFVVCGWREEAVAGVFLTYVLGTFYICFFMYQGYERWKNCKPSCKGGFFSYTCTFCALLPQCCVLLYESSFLRMYRTIVI